MYLQVKNLSFNYGQRFKEFNLTGINLSVQHKEVAAVLGVSGAGKSTLLKILAGIITNYQGEVLLTGKNIKHTGIITAYHSQQDLLLPWKNIEDNLILPLTLKGISKKDAFKAIIPYLAEFNLGGHLKKYPGELSGGERQRAALLRTLLVDSKIMLLDEPFSALDALTKQKMQGFLASLIKKYNYTGVLVTHDIDEAIFLADKIYVLNKNGSLSKPLNINLPKAENETRLLSNEFLEYKKQILSLLKYPSA